MQRAAYPVAAKMPVPLHSGNMRCNELKNGHIKALSSCMITPVAENMAGRALDNAFALDKWSDHSNPDYADGAIGR